MTEPLTDAVSTRVDSTLSALRDHDIDLQTQWQSLIDHTLIEWGRNPAQLEDEGVEPPNAETIAVAIDLARAVLKQAGLRPPDSVVPDANGGIVFEWREDGVSRLYHLWDAETIEYQRFDGTRLVKRLRLQQ